MAVRSSRPLSEIEAGKEYRRKQRAKAKTARKGKQAKRKASRSPGGYQAGGGIDEIPLTPEERAWGLARTKRKRAYAKAKAKAKRAKAKTVRTGKQAKRQATRSPGGFAGGGTIESYSAQVKRKYGGGKI